LCSVIRNYAFRAEDGNGDEGRGFARPQCLTHANIVPWAKRVLPRASASPGEQTSQLRKQQRHLFPSYFVRRKEEFRYGSRLGASDATYVKAMLSARGRLHDPSRGRLANICRPPPTARSVRRIGHHRSRGDGARRSQHGLVGRLKRKGGTLSQLHHDEA